MKRTESETGKVLEVSGGRARVEVSPGGMCSHCEMASACMPAAGETRTIEVVDPLGVSPGQSVRVELGGGQVVLAALVAYAIPAVALFAGALIGFGVAPASSAELWSAVGAIACLVVGVLISRALGQRLGGRGKLIPVITAVVSDHDVEVKGDAHREDTR
jgi:positive regulator of sigma E activity